MVLSVARNFYFHRLFRTRAVSNMNGHHYSDQLMRKNACLLFATPPRMRRIGYWMSAKKLKKLDMDKFEVICRAGGYELVPVDITAPLSGQGPFDVFLHKLTDLIVQAEQDDAGDSFAVELFREMESYMIANPQTIVIDPIENLKKLLLRHRQYHLTATSNACQHDKVFAPSFVRLHSADPRIMLEEMRSAGVEFPVVCKAEQAHGSIEAHSMMIIFNADGLQKIKVPCVAQTFVNHDAVLYKIFVIGEKFHIIRRPSFENFYSTDLPPISFDSQNIIGSRWLEDEPVDRPLIAASCVSDRPTVVLDPEIVAYIVKGIREQFGLSLIGIDIIVEKTTGRYAIIDVNAFPSYSGVDDFFPHLLLHIDTIVRQRDSKLALNNGHAIHLKPAGLKPDTLPIPVARSHGRTNGMALPSWRL